ncbi:right-handed parallel beta-helix repeat-containing protein [Sphaerothrix gracilis]|uniref:right-handed parallel beta-helix repeat-containing protein n=1 Tax=Sphaerothrix gracilis TaxID=3151835 RepID=UPI0031FD1D83
MPIRLPLSALRRCLYLSCLLAVIAPIAPTAAQTLEPTIDLAQVDEQTSSAATDLRIDPRWRINYNSDSGGYNGGFTGFEGFIPLLQTPGSHLVYLVPRVSLDDDAELGGSLLAGYRFLSGSTLLGGYAGFDFRDTGRSSFTQFSAGLEAFGDVWDVHLNTYLPLGDRRNQVAGSSSASGVPTNLRFQGNQLVFDLGSFSQAEAALSGVDFEAGFRLIELPAGWGNLWAYSGLYYYGGNESDDSLGVRMRLDYRLQENLRFGLGVQNDDLFGTNVFFSVNASVGGPTQLPEAEAVDPEALVWARAAESLTRNHSIIVEQQTERSLQTDVAINPDTQEAYFFLHVTPGGGDGSGTVEDPQNAIASALLTANSGNIVYVRPGDTATNPLSGFTIPAEVQVLSSGVEQSLSIQSSGSVITAVLPDFGDRGTLPRIENGVTLIGGNNTLAGFDVFNGPSGIVVNGASGAILRDNQVSNNSVVGISLENSDGVQVLNNTLVDNRSGIAVTSGSDEAIIQGNQVSRINDAAITVQNSNGSTIQQNTLLDSRLGIVTNNGVGLRIQENEISQIGETAIALQAGSHQATIAQNTISNAQSGIAVSQSDSLTVQNNEISQIDSIAIGLNTVTAGVIQNNQLFNAQQGVNALGSDNLLIQDNEIFNISVAPISLTDSDGALIQRNQISNSSNVGIGIFDTVGVEIVDNQLSQIATLGTTNPATTLPAAIYLNQVTGTASITGNTVTGTSTGNGNPSIEGQAIAVGNVSGDLDLAIANNTIGGPNPSDNNAGDGIVVVMGGTATGTIAITNNQIEGNGTSSPLAGDGIQVAVEGNNNLASLTIANNTITNNVDDGIDLRVGTILAGNPQLRASITNNTIQGHSNGQGINIQAQQNGSTVVNGTSQADVAIQSNTLSNNSTDVRAIASGNNPFPMQTTASRVCLRLQDNVLQDNFALIQQNEGLLQLEPPTGNSNSNTVTMTGTITSVSAATCQTP